jgi:hypothetical protein
MIAVKDRSLAPAERQDGMIASARHVQDFDDICRWAANQSYRSSTLNA